MAKQFKTYCRIYDYIEHVDPDMASLLRGTCAEMILSSLRGKPGVTFLCPKDKAFREKLEKLAYSAKTEDAAAASDMLTACIIRDVVKTPAEWKSREIANSLYPPQIVEVASTSADEVVFKSGARAVLDKEFAKSSRNPKLAVWNLVSGELPVTTDKPATRPPKGKVGGYAAIPVQTQTERYKIGLAVENAYALGRLNREAGVGGARCCVYLDHVLSLINYVAHVRNDHALLQERIIPVVSFDKLDFYLLVEPHRTSGQYLLDDGLIHEWWVNKEKHKFAPHSIVALVEKTLMAPNPAKMYSDRPALLDAISAVRRRVGQVISARPRSSVTEIAKVYEELEESNTIGGVGPVFPAALAQYYAADKGLKMIQDELRYLTFGSFGMLEANAFDLGAFHELTNMIGECLQAADNEARSSQHKLLGKSAVQYLIAPTGTIEEIRVFLYSTMFVFVPMTSADASNLKTKSSTQRPDPSNIVVYNIAKNLYARHDRLLPFDSATPANVDVVAALRSLDINTLDPALREELKNKFA
jgi:hypothetical protein